MQKLKHSRLLPITGLLLGMLVWLANNGNPPTGRTAAPFDNGNCNNCHTGSSFNGNITVTGFPATADPNALYDINVKMTVTAGSPTKAGFQMVVVDANNDNCGDLIESVPDLGTEFFMTREYVEQRNGKAIAGGMVSWDFQWKAPPSVPGNSVKVYYIVNLCNGNGGSSGDNPVWDNLSFGFAGPPPLVATITNTANPTCNGGNNGSATVEATGGTPPYTYAWAGGQTTQTAINLAAGTYTVSVTAANGVTATASTTLTQPTAVTLSTSVMGTVSCVSSATATATAGGGTPGYTYLWSDGQTSNVATFDQTGVFSVIATDAAGCTKSATANITGNTTPPISIAGPSGVITCAVPQLQLNGTGSSTGATIAYLWTASNGGNIVSGGATLAPTVNACGTYTLKVTNSSNGCTATASTTVTCNTTPPNASASGATINCANPTVSLMGNSTTPGVTFRWTGPGINPNNQDQQNPVVDQAGSYTLTVTDTINGCTKTAPVTVSLDTAPPTATGSVSGQLTCVVTSAQLNLTTNAPNPVFGWTGPNGFSSNIANPNVSVAGDYYGAVTNTANGCLGFDTITVVQNTTAPFDSIVAPGNLNCNNPSIQLNGTPSSQGPNFDYLWTTKEGGRIVSGDTTLTPVVDSTGKYFLTVINTDNGCTALDSVVVNQSPPVSASISASNNVSCNGGSNGSATALGDGGNGVFIFHWSNGDTSATTTELAAGTYLVSVTDGENCTASATVVVTQPDPILANASVTGETSNNANDGTASANPSGGTAGYSYLWSNGQTSQTITNLAPGSYTVNVADANACTAFQTVTVNAFGCNLQAAASSTNATCNGANDGTATVTLTGAADPVTYTWSNGATTQIINNLAPATYTVSIVDGNNCPAVLSVSIGEPPALSANASATAVTANGASDGTATANPTGGTPDYTYAWSNNASTQSISGLAPGAYSVVVTDGNGCTSAQIVNVAAFNCALSATITSANVPCFGGTDGQASVAVIGGTLPYTYVWSNGTSTQTATGLSAGTYTVSATDAAGCATSVSVDIIVTDNQAPAMICPDNIPICGEGAINYGAPSTSDNCGVASPPVVISGPPSGSIFPLGISSIVYQATDISGNTATCSFSITVYELPDVQLDDVSNDVNGQGLGAISISVVGDDPFGFTWSKDGQPFANSEDLTGLTAGSYTVIVIDNNGCSITLPTIVITNSVGTSAPDLVGSVRLWPNPAQSAIQLEIIDLDVIAACIVDFRGSLVQEIRPAELSGEIDIQQLPEGMYCLKIGAANGRVLSLKFVKTGN